ncbi:E3 ubiquitin-protein ligase RSL1-like [Vicia villosa]|uniref:E3 ubiquitin-protein ligase RSL1-like n=1 Tax=Vicia villosa TaxID=3911 RepID=UPI00273CBCB0|nr:E3 ubiquitin-protein ligase RSL1-like [Vicia villosa]
MASEATPRRRRNRVQPSTPEVIDLDSFRSYNKRTMSAATISSVINLSDEEDDDIKILDFIPKNTFLRKRKRIFEKGESSNSSNIPFVCEICTDTKTMKEAFYISGCSHAYCSDCVANYIGSKLEDNIVNISCPVPECKGSLEAQICRTILPAEVFEKWSKGLCEALINASQKFYCPFANCSALLINDETEAVTNSECPNCNRMFCAQCKVPWHDGIKCSEFQKLNAGEREKEDIMLVRLAQNKHWRRCPNCKIYVARTMGCNIMRCRCQCSFCYKCGGTYTRTAAGRCTCNGTPQQPTPVFHGTTVSNSYLNYSGQQQQTPYGVYTGKYGTGGTYSYGSSFYPGRR